jgi:hypothetical protein
MLLVKEAVTVQEIRYCAIDLLLCKGALILKERCCVSREMFLCRGAVVQKSFDSFVCLLNSSSTFHLITYSEIGIESYSLVLINRQKVKACERNETEFVRLVINAGDLSASCPNYSLPTN